MSYILEALKRSQQARELGRVPTLDTTGILSDEKEPVPRGHWGLLSVGLASVAVVIALYAVLRAPPPPIVSQGGAAEAMPSGRAEETAATPSPTDRRETPLDEGTSIAAAGSAAGAPLVEPPPRRSPAAETPATRPLSAGYDADDEGEVIGEDELAYESELDPWLEQELQRQLDAEQVMDAEPSQPPTPARRPERAPVPVDLVEDIEAFKQQVRREQGIPPPPSKRQPADIRGDPTKLRLTPVQQAQLPAYFMTVHVYDADASKRFVLINALRYGEGEETREGIRVERIVPEGAVLSYLGNPFFVRR
ncbi:MAG: general secretion pathway protein GspB [Thiocapsa sp.]|jgi:general secretion pathway protein B|nr:general secretion pathway protein GspB [Thiocapsa sp.]MCG6895632.1 general secretion pathway protein GspB [Thiocapsa sp.]MCG6984967.1 general secretion pathway protein GspB [Thiocapsa sp.]